jgi:hypothetical protein
MTRGKGALDVAHVCLVAVIAAALVGWHALDRWGESPSFRRTSPLEKSIEGHGLVLTAGPCRTVMLSTGVCLPPGRYPRMAVLVFESAYVASDVTVQGDDLIIEPGKP